MAVTMGTNAGFVTVAPTDDPNGAYGDVSIDDNKRALKVTVPSNATKITELGWWCGSESGESNFEIGIFDDNSSSPNNLISKSDTNAKGTTIGWKRVTGLNIDISSYQNAVVWLGVQVDDTTIPTAIDRESSLGEQYNYNLGGITTLSDPWGASTPFADVILPIYAVYESGTDYSQTTSESLSISDSTQKTTSKGITEAVSVSDSLGHIWTSYRILSESSSVSDSLYKGIAATVPETVSISDSIDEVWTAIRMFTENVAVADYVSEYSIKGGTYMIRWHVSLGSIT